MRQLSLCLSVAVFCGGCTHLDTVDEAHSGHQAPVVVATSPQADERIASLEARVETLEQLVKALAANERQVEPMGFGPPAPTPVTLEITCFENPALKAKYTGLGNSITEGSQLIQGNCPDGLWGSPHPSIYSTAYGAHYLPAFDGALYSASRRHDAALKVEIDKLRESVKATLKELKELDQ